MSTLTELEFLFPFLPYKQIKRVTSKKNLRTQPIVMPGIAPPDNFYFFLLALPPTTEELPPATVAVGKLMS